MDILFVALPTALSRHSWRPAFQHMLSLLRCKGFKADVIYPLKIALRASHTQDEAKEISEAIFAVFNSGRGHDYHPNLASNPFFAELFEEMITRIKKASPKLIGFSPYDGELPVFLNFIGRLRQNGISSKIVLGGHFASLAHDKILRYNPKIDLIVRGEGEEIICELLTCIVNGGDLGAVQGLSYRKDGKLIANPPRALIEKLDALPPPADDYIFPLFKTSKNNPLRAILRPNLAKGCPKDSSCFEFIPVYSSRGCYYNCSYCSINKFYRLLPNQKRWRALSPKVIVDYISHLHKKYKAFLFNFTDDTFMGGHLGAERAVKIAKEIRRRGLKIKFVIGARSDEISSPLLKKMKRAGLKMVFFGIESFIQRGLDTFNKHMTVEQNHDAINLLAKNKIFFNGNIIFFDPYLKIEEMRDNLSFIKAIRRQNNIGRLEPFLVLRVFNGTSIASRLKKDGFLRGNYIEYTYKYSDCRTGKVFSLVNDVLHHNELPPIVRDIVLGFNVNLLKVDDAIWRRNKDVAYNISEFVSSYLYWSKFFFLPQIIEAACFMEKRSCENKRAFKLLREMVARECDYIKKASTSGLQSFLAGNKSGLQNHSCEFSPHYYDIFGEKTLTLLKIDATKMKYRNFIKTYNFLTKLFAFSKDMRFEFVGRSGGQIPKKIVKFCLEQNIKFVKADAKDNCIGFCGTTEKRIHYCQAGITSFWVCPNGDIFACGKFKDNELLKVGNAFDNTWDEVNWTYFAHASVDKKSLCWACRSKYMCGGGCAFAAYVKNGTVYKPDKKECISIKKCKYDDKTQSKCAPVSAR